MPEMVGAAVGVGAASTEGTNILTSGPGKTLAPRDDGKLLAPQDDGNGTCTGIFSYPRTSSSGMELERRGFSRTKVDEAVVVVVGDRRSLGFLDVQPGVVDQRCRPGTASGLEAALMALPLAATMAAAR